MWHKYKNKDKFSVIESYKVDLKERVLKLKLRTNQKVFSILENNVGNDTFDKLIAFAQSGKGLLRFLEYKQIDLEE
jgi:hypothetical protein